MSSGRIRVIHGVNDNSFPIEGATVGSVQASLVDAFNLPDNAIAFANGRRVSSKYRLLRDDVLEYILEHGSKGGVVGNMQVSARFEASEIPQVKLPLNQHGGIDITDDLPDGLVHVDLPRVGFTCKRLKIEYGRAIVGWNEVRRQRIKKSYPTFSGVIVRETDLAKLMNAVEEKARKRKQRVAKLPVMSALFTLNRRAKRCRDLAQSYYQSRMHGFAGKMKREKNRIYELKGQVLHHLVESGVLAGGKYHRFEQGNCTEVLEGGGYRFHRPCPPQDTITETYLIASIEAKPKESKEPTLDIAYEVIDNFLKDKAPVTVYEWPPIIHRNYQARDSSHDDDEDDDDDDYDIDEEWDHWDEEE